MGNFFNPDNKFFTFMGKVFDVILLNIYWLLLYVPFFVFLYIFGTTGIIFWLVPMILSLIVVVPSFVALYYSMVKSVRHNRSYVTKEFFRSFVSNFKQGAIASAIFLSIVAFLSLDLFYLIGLCMPENANTTVLEYVINNGFLYAVTDVLNAGTTKQTILLGGYIAISFLTAGTFIFFCPIISRFEMRLGNCFKFSFGSAIKHLGTTILSILLWIAVFLATYITYGFVLLFGIAAGVYVESLMMEKILKKYVKQVLDERQSTGEIEASEGTDTTGHEDESRDEWYVE